MSKLVRDKIPEIIKRNGEIPNIRVANDQEYWQKLKEKLQEEVDEFLKDNSEEELIDILGLTIKKDETKGKEIISDIVLRLYRIARMLNPIMPETNEKLKKLIRENKKPETPLFPRKD